MPQSELDELIEAYESEKKNLEAFIKEALEEEQYLLCEYYKKGLYKLRTTLENLNSLKDRFYSKKINSQKMIARWESWETDSTRRVFGKNVEEEKKKLQEMLSQSSFLTPNENELTDALHDVIEGKNAGFNLNLKNILGFNIEIRNIDSRYLLISIPLKSEIPGQEISLKLRSMPGLGFVSNPELNTIEYFYDLSNFKGTNDIKQLLARIIFDCSFYREFDKPGAIEYF
jgi:hypothetical protein